MYRKITFKLKYASGRTITKIISDPKGISAEERQEIAANLIKAGGEGASLTITAGQFIKDH